MWFFCFVVVVIAFVDLNGVECCRASASEPWVRPLSEERARWMRRLVESPSGHSGSQQETGNTSFVLSLELKLLSQNDLFVNLHCC